MTSHGDNQACTGLILQLGGQLSVCKVGVAIAAVVVLQHALFQAGSFKALAGRSDVVASHGDVQAQTSLVFHLHSALGICKVGVAIAAVVVLDDALFQAGSLKAFAGRSDVVCSQLALGLTAALTSSCLGAGGFAECVAQSMNIAISVAGGAAIICAQMQGEAPLSTSCIHNNGHPIVLAHRNNNSFSVQFFAAVLTVDNLVEGAICIMSSLNHVFNNTIAIDMGTISKQDLGVLSSAAATCPDNIAVLDAVGSQTLNLDNKVVSTSSENHFALFQQSATSLAVSITSITISTTSSGKCITDLGSQVTSCGNHSSLGSTTGTSLNNAAVLSAGCIVALNLSSVIVITSCRNHSAVLQLGVTNSTPDIASVAIGAAAFSYSITDFGLAMAQRNGTSLNSVVDQRSGSSSQSLNRQVDLVLTILNNVKGQGKQHTITSNSSGGVERNTTSLNISSQVAQNAGSNIGQFQCLMVILNHGSHSTDTRIVLNQNINGNRTRGADSCITYSDNSLGLCRKSGSGPQASAERQHKYNTQNFFHTILPFRNYCSTGNLSMIHASYCAISIASMELT